jgi:hypothetical protein
MNPFSSRPFRVAVYIAVLLGLLSACAPALTATPAPATTETPIPAEPTEAATATPTPAEVTAAPEVYDPTKPETWVYLPVIPETVSQKMKDLYLEGQAGNLNPDAFSKAGDCETYTDYFLAPFDLHERGYSLGEYGYLEGVITRYEGSFSRRSLAAERSFSASSLISSLYADKELCKSNEFPLICEIRVHKPAIMLVMLGTNDTSNSSPQKFEENLRKVLENILASKVVPVLATKADNLEGDGSFNAIIAKLAYEYEVPLWNLWRAMKDLPGGGLQADQVHHTYAKPMFDNPENMLMGWPVRNLTALQVLEKVTNELNP